MDNDVKYTVLESNNNVMDSNWNGIVKYKYENWKRKTKENKKRISHLFKNKKTSNK